MGACTIYNFIAAVASSIAAGMSLWQWWKERKEA